MCFNKHSCRVNIKFLIVSLVICTLLNANSLVLQAQSNFYVTPLFWKADGDQIAVVRDNVVEIYNTTSEALFALEGHSNQVSMVAWSPDNTILATASYDQSVRLWNARNGSEIRVLSGHNSPVSVVKWLQDGKLVSIDIDEQPNVYVWDTQTGELLKTYIGGSGVDAAISPDGQLFSYITPGSIHILDSTSIAFEQVGRYREPLCCSNVMYSLAWSTDGTKLVTGSANGLITIWDAKDVNRFSQLQANAYSAFDGYEIQNIALSWVRDVSFSPDGSSILAVSGDGTVREWDINNPEVFIETQIGALATASWSPYGGRLAVVDLTLKDGSTLTDLQAFDSNELAGQFTMIVPFADKGRVEKLAEACAMPSDILEQVKADLLFDKISEVIARVKAVDKSQIQPACAADLIAVAEAILTGQE